MTKRIGIFLMALLVMASLLCAAHAQTAEKNWKKTITLPSGEVVCDLNGEWDALYENLGDHQWIGNIKDMLKITQKGDSFAGVKMIGSIYVPKDAVSITGELDKNGVKKSRVVLLTAYDKALDCKGQIREDGNKIILDGGERMRVTLTRK